MIIKLAKNTIAGARIVAAAEQLTGPVLNSRPMWQQKSIVINVIESFTDRTVMTRTSEEPKVFATNLESVTNVAKLTSSTLKRNITAITLFAQTVKKWFVKFF